MDPLLTRRQTLQSLAFSAVFGGSLLGLVGCGGGGGHHGGRAATSNVKVAVEIPSGLTIPVADLQGGTAYGLSPLMNGSFSTKISSKGPTFVYLQQKSIGGFVLFGLVGPGRPGVTALASAVLMVALGLNGPPAKDLRTALDLFETDSNVQTLAATITMTLATDPFALTNGNAMIGDAVKAAVDAIGGTVSLGLVRSATRAEITPLIAVSPTGDQGGAEVDQGDPGYVVPTNTKRRPVSAYTYLVGHVAADGTTTSVSPAKRVDQQDIDATTSIVGSLASLGAKAAFAPVTGHQVELPISGTDTKSLYETVILMASGDNSTAPGFFSDPKYTGELADWHAKTDTLNLSAFLGGILFDLFNSVLAGASAAVSLTQVNLAVAAIDAAGAEAEASILTAARAGQYGRAASYMLNILKANDASLAGVKFRQAILEILGDGEAAAEMAAAGLEGVAIGGLAAAALAAARHPPWRYGRRGELLRRHDLPQG